MSKKFKKKVENFICENCGLEVIGQGYTNHCPKCLWSKHVDVFPGDRSENCRGFMRPIGLKIENGKESIFHKCEKCGEVRLCKVSGEDDRGEILNLSQLPLPYFLD